MPYNGEQKKASFYNYSFFVQLPSSSDVSSYKKGIFLKKTKIKFTGS
jgi:hypothetical protein